LLLSKSELETLSTSSRIETRQECVMPEQPPDPKNYDMKIPPEPENSTLQKQQNEREDDATVSNDRKDASPPAKKQTEQKPK
jgi:hypothetical protein